MSDEFDKVQEHEEYLRETAIKNQCSKPDKFLPPATGFCFNCGDPVLLNQHFCDSDCRDDWEKARNARQRNRGQS